MNRHAMLTAERHYTDTHIADRRYRDTDRALTHVGFLPSRLSIHYPVGGRILEAVLFEGPEDMLAAHRLREQDNCYVHDVSLSGACGSDLTTLLGQLFEQDPAHVTYLNEREFPVQRHDPVRERYLHLLGVHPKRK